MTGEGVALVESRRLAMESDVVRVRGLLVPDPKHCTTLCFMEAEVLRLIGLGLTNAEIGLVCGITANTVRTYAKRLHDKCVIRGRARLAIVASRMD